MSQRSIKTFLIERLHLRQANMNRKISSEIAVRMLLILAEIILIGIPGAARAGESKPFPKVVEFNRDIRPIFSDTCFKCHGPDVSKRKGKLRLDTREGAFSDHEGVIPFVPGDLAKSEAWRRITATNADDLMPPADSGMKLTDRQIKLLGLWIKQGAKFSEHWAFIPPVAPPLPKVRHRSWPKNPIDYFILARLEEENLKPSREADKTIPHPAGDARPDRFAADARRNRCIP